MDTVQQDIFCERMLEFFKKVRDKHQKYPLHDKLIAILHFFVFRKKTVLVSSNDKKLNKTALSLVATPF